MQNEIETYLNCGRFERGFLRVRCEDCRVETLVAFSCKRRGFCPSCGARRMTESAALLADEELPPKPLRQWVLSLPFALRFLLPTSPRALTQVLGVVYRTISTHVLRNARLTTASGATGAVTLIQRFGPGASAARSSAKACWSGRPKMTSSSSGPKRAAPRTTWSATRSPTG